MRKIPLMYLFIIGVALAIIAVLVLWYSGILVAESVITDILLIVVQWVVITSLALLGAFLLGMFFGHRITAMRGFTPFEQEMLRMRGEIAEIHRKVENIMDGLDSLREMLKRQT